MQVRELDNVRWFMDCIGRYHSEIRESSERRRIEGHTASRIISEKILTKIEQSHERLLKEDTERMIELQKMVLKAKQRSPTTQSLRCSQDVKIDLAAASEAPKPHSNIFSKVQWVAVSFASLVSAAA